MPIATSINNSSIRVADLELLKQIDTKSKKALTDVYISGIVLRRLKSDKYVVGNFRNTTVFPLHGVLSLCPPYPSFPTASPIHGMADQSVYRFSGGDTVVGGQEVTCCVLIHTGSHSGCGAPY